MISSAAILAAVAVAAHASPLSIRNNNGPPSVTINNGTLVGLSQTQFGQELFLGIPYADPPKRLARSRSVSTSFGTKQATSYGPLCWSSIPPGGYNDNSGFESSEDCLTLNVVRPYGVYEGQKKVPVAFWIHGGGLNTGGTGDYRYNATGFVQASVDNGEPIIFVSANYRLASFGFLASKELQEANAVNLGFLDQRLAMQWVQANIEKFGGDPDKVTIFGESAGGSSVLAHIQAYGGRDDGLFRQAIIESGGGGGTNSEVSAFQATYDTLLANSTCSSTSRSSVDAQLECIRGLDVGTYRNVTNGRTGPVRDGQLIQAKGQAAAFREGKWVKVPMMVGTNTDEGQSFSQAGTNTTDQRRAAFASLSDTDYAALIKLYPDDPKLGVPFDTGDFSLDGSVQNGAYVTPGRYNKQVAAIVGDQSMFAPARYLAQTLSGQIPFYKYLFDHVPYDVSYGVEDFVGHFIEVAYVFNTQNNNTAFWEKNHFTATYLGPGANINDRALGSYMSRLWTSFIATGDPNNANWTASTPWPKYSEAAEQIVFRVKGSTTEKDDNRKEGVQYMIDNIIKTSS